jgi:hypothetical protein
MMLSFKGALFILWYVASVGALCRSTTIKFCVTNGEDTESDHECQHHHLILHALSDITISETSCRTVGIKLTSGTHILSRNLDFSNSVQETEIKGASVLQQLRY